MYLPDDPLDIERPASDRGGPLWVVLYLCFATVIAHVHTPVLCCMTLWNMPVRIDHPMPDNPPLSPLFTFASKVLPFLGAPFVVAAWAAWWFRWYKTAVIIITIPLAANFYYIGLIAADPIGRK